MVVKSLVAKEQATMTITPHRKEKFPHPLVGSYTYREVVTDELYVEAIGRALRYAVEKCWYDGYDPTELMFVVEFE